MKCACQLSTREEKNILVPILVCCCQWSSRGEVFFLSGESDACFGGAATSIFSFGGGGVEFQLETIPEVMIHELLKPQNISLAFCRVHTIHTILSTRETMNTVGGLTQLRLGVSRAAVVGSGNNDFRH